MFAAKRIPQLLLPGLCLISSSCVTLTSNSDPNQIKTAISVPHLTLYVRSPYTTPAQLVKIENVSAQGTMICPFTKRPFYVPGHARGSAAVRGQTRYLESPSQTASKAKREAATAEAIVKEERKKNDNVTILHERRPDNFRPLRKAEASVEETPAAAATLPSMLEPQLDDATSTTATTAATSRETSNKLPYGIRVPGQSDFVRSPFAEAHQLVDVAGMPVGSEVKCPYSGKLFRVPPQ